MEKKARILIVEDDAIVAEDLAMAISDMGYEVAGGAVSAEQAVRKTLELSPDLILMDIMLKGKKNGIDASHEIKKETDIPIIFLTAYSDAGLIDKAKNIEPYAYIIKPFQERQLLASIEIALYKSMTEKKLKESEEWLSTILRSIGDGVIATDLKGCVTLMNPVAEVLTGWKQEEAFGKPFNDVFQIINAETGRPAEDPVTRVILEGVVVNLANNTLLIAKDGTKRPIDDSGAPIRYDKGNVLGVVLVFSDITERKQAEEELHAANEQLRANYEQLKASEHDLRESEEKYRTLVETIEEGIGNVDEKETFTFVNQAAADIFGCSKEELIGKNLKEFATQDEYQRIRKQTAIRKTNKSSKYDMIITRKNGTNRIIEVTATPRIGEDGKLLGTFGIFHDITERNKANEEIRKLSKVVETTPEAVVMTDMQGKIEYVNNGLLTLGGFEDDKNIIGESIFLFSSEEGIKQLQEKIIPTILSEGKWRGEVSVKRKDSSFFPTEMICSCILDEEGKSKYLLSQYHDITSRKQAEKKLSESEEKFRTITESAVDSIFIKNVDSEYIHVNPAMEKLFGQSASKLIGKTDIELFGEEAEKHIIELDKKVIEGEILIDEHEKAVRGKLHSFHTIRVPLRNSEGKIIGICGIARDITERKQAAEAIQKSEEKYRTLFETAKDAIFLSDETGKFIDVNQAAIESLGYSKEELLKLSIKDIDVETVGYDEFSKIISGIEKEVAFIVTQKRKDGTLFPVEITGNIFPGGDKKVTLAIARDITERKQAEKALRESEAQKRAILDGITTNIAFVNENLEILWVNKASAISAGKSPKEMIGHKCYELWADPEKPCDGCPTLKAWKTRKSEYLIMTTPDGRVWDEKGEPVFDQNGELIGMVEIAQDITERKQAEEALKKSEKQLQTLIDNMPDFVCFKDGDGRWLLANEAGIRIFQLEGIDYLGKKDSELAELNKKLQGSFLTCKESDAKAWKEGCLIHAEETSPDADGSVRVYDVTKVPVSYSDGERKGLIIIGHDITERKQVEEELHKRLNELETFNRVTVDRELKMIELKKEINELLGKSGKEAIYKIAE